MSNIIDKMYDDLKAKGYLSKDRDTFNKFFFAPGETGYQNRKKLYDDLHNKGYLQSPSYEDFAQRIGLHSVRPSQTASRQQDVAQQANNRAAAQAAAAKSAPTQPVKGGWRPNAEQMARYQQITDGVMRTIKNGEDVMNQVNTLVARATRPSPHMVSLGFNNKNKHSPLGGASQVQYEGKKFDAAKGDFVDQYSTEAGNVYDNAYEADIEQYKINRNKRDAETLDMVADIERQIREQEKLLEKTRKASRAIKAPDNLWDALRYTMSHADGPRLDQEDIDEEAIKANITNLQNKRSLLLHGTSIGQKVGKSIGDQLAEVNRMIGDDIDNYYKRHPNGGPTLVSHDYHATGQYQISPYLDVAARSLEDAQEMFNEAGKSVGESGLTGFGKGVIRGFGSKLFDARTWDMGYTDLKGGLSLAEVLKRADEGKPLTVEQQKMLDAKATELACAAYFSGALGRGYKAGQVTAESIPFMLEFMLNPLSKTGMSAQAMLTRYALKRFGRKATMELGEDAAKKILYGDIRQLTKSVFDKGLSKGARGLAAKTLVSKAGARIAGDITGAAGMTATTGQGRVVADMLNRATGQVKFGVDTDGKVKYTGHDAPEESNLLKAYGKAFGSQFCENYSEFMGPYISYVGGMFANGLKKIGGKYLFDGLSSLRNRSAAAVMKLPFAPMVSDFIREATKSDWAKVIKGMQKRAHWDGTAEEYLEEVAGNMLNAILVGDNDFSTEEGRGVFNLSDNIDTFLGVGLMSGAMSVSSAAGYRTPAYRARKMVENADARGEKLLGGSLWGKFRSSFDAAQSEQDKQVILTSLLQNSSLTNEGRMAALQYARGKQFQQAVADGTFREMEEDAEKGNEVERACRAEYTEGQNIDSVEEMRDAKTRYNVLLREALAVEPNAEMYSDPQFYEQSNPNATPEQKAAMRAYAEAKAQYEGVADRMKTDMVDQQQKANEQVERFKNQTDGLITRVRLRGSDAEFYVTSGHISLNNDGTINDAATSSNLTIVDGEGNQRFISRGDVVDVLAQNTPEETLEQLNDIIMNEAKAKADLIDGKLSFRAGDTFTILNNEGQEQKVTITQDPSTMAMSAVIEGEQAAVPLTEDSMAKLQQMSDAYQESRFGKYRQEQQDAVANAENEATPASPTASQEETSSPTEGRSYGYGESVSYVDGEGHTQDGVVHGKTPDGTYEVEFDNPPSGKNVVDEYTQEELDALVQPSSAEQTEEVAPSTEAPTEATAEEEPAEQTKDNAVAQSPKKDVPRDKDGNIIYDQVPVATTIEDLYDGALDDEEIGNFVQSQIDAANKAVDKITKKKPQISTNKSAYLEAKKKWEGELREAERKAQYWNDVKAEVEKITTPADARGWKDELSGEAARRQYRENSGNDHEAKSASEVAAEFFSQSHVKVTPESYRKETGFGLDEQRKMVGKISKEGKTIDQLSEELALFDEEYYNGRFFGGDSMVAKDALIAHLSSADARKGIAKVQSEAEAQFVEDYEEQRERYYQERYHMSYEEYIEYSAQEMPELMRKYSNFDEQQFYNRYADEIEADLTRREQQSNNNNGTEENDSTREEQRHDRGNQVQSGQRTDDNSGSERGKDSEGEVRTRDEGSDEQESSSEESAVEGLREQEADIEQGEGANEEIKPIGKSRFGNIYDQFKGKIKEAFNFLMKHKSGDLLGVFHREGFGDVDLVWGSNERSEGLDHIIEKHIKAHNDFDSVEDAMTTIDDVIRNGSLNEAKSKWDKVIFEKDGYTVVVSLNVRDNQGNITDNNKKWIVTAFDGSHRQSNKKRESSSDATLVTPSTNEGGRAVAPDDDSSDGKGKEKVSSKQGSVGRKNVYGKNKVADWRTSVSSAMRQYETSPHDAHVAMCDIIDGMDSNALYGLMRMVLRTITSLDNENIRDGWKVDATHDLFDILKDRGFVVTKGSKGVAIGDVVIDKHGIIYVVEGVGKSRLDCGLYDVNDKTIIDHMTISRASVKYYYRDVNGKKDSERSQKADVVDAELMAEEKPFNAIIEMLRKKFPDASMEALTAADRLLREQALPGERQKAIEAVAKALGLKVEWRDTMEKENGTFNPKTRTITIARDSEHALANTFGHEVTHAVRNLSEADYKNLKDAVRRLYSSEKEYNEAVQAYGDMYTGLDFDALEEELIADNIGFMIGGRNDMTQELASRMNHRVLWAIHDAMNKVRNALAKVLHIDSKKNGLLEAIDSARATIRETMANAQRIAKEKGQGHSNESGSARQSLRTQDTPLLDVDGKPIVVKADDGKVELNLRTWQDEKQQVRDALLDGGLEPEAVDAMMAQAETIASGMSGLLGKYPLFGAWQKVAATNRPILRNNNGGYLSFDYSFNCVKKDALNAVMEALVADGKGSHLGVTQVEALKKVLQKHGFLTPCVMCYVEAKRKVYKQSKEMAAKWNAVAETVGLNGEEMGAERELGAEQRHALEQLANGENLGSVKGFAAQGGDGIKKDTIVKIAKLMLNSAKLRGRMNYEWLMSPNSYTEMYNKFGDTGLMEFISQGQSRGKALLEASPFSFKSIPSDLMTGMYNPVALANLGGVRQFSYEDARAVMFFDYYTQFLVMQGARAPEHLYTKRPFMPEMFGRTGAMMNQSLIVDIWRGEEWHKKALGLSDKDYDAWLTAHAGFVPRGALPKGHTLYEVGSTELVPNWGVESFPVDIAMKNVHNKDYKGTVGNVVVAPNREFILWALDNPDIHMVLAYHASGANPLMKSLTGYDRAEAMDDGYHTYDKDGKVVSELSVPGTGLEIHGGALQWNVLLRRNGYDARKAAQVYLDYCKEHGLTPMFCYDGVVDMSGERATSHPEYYKLLTDFRVYDEDGNSIRQRAVKAVLPENWQVILDKYLQQESALSGKVGNIRLDEGLMNEINAVTRFASIESGERDTLTKLLTSIYGKGNVQVLATREFDAALDEVTDRGHAQMLRDNGGTVYGFAVGDRIVLNEDLFNANTPMHEHTHVYMKVLKATNPRLYNRGMELWRDTPLWNQAKRGLEALGEEPTDDRIFSECMSQFTGAENEKIISEVTGITDKNWLQKAMSWLSEMWKGVKSAFARWTQKDLDGLTAEQFGRMPLRAVYDAKERKAYTERVEQVFGDGGASAHDVVAKHEALTKPTAGPREAERMEIKQSLRDGTFIQSGSYFSGGGLLEEGLKNYLDPKVAVEFNSKISGVYADNHGRHIVTADVRDVDPATLVGQLDNPVEYFHASPVCKNFSRAKREAGEVELDKETARSTADFIKANHPKVVTIENVKGYRDSEALKIITDELSRQGYDWDMDVYNAADFGGYTSRERLIVRAVRDGELPPKPKAIAKEDRKKGWMEAVSDLIPTLHEKRSGVPEWMDSRLKAEGIDWHNIDKPLYVFGQGNNKNSVPHAFADELLPTLRTKGGDVIIMPDGRVLRAEPRVLARVTGLSDDYHMPITDDLAHTIVGNGIPAQLSQGVIGPLLEGVFNGGERVTDDVKASKRGEERHAIVASAIEDGTYMKAPNGEDSNLDEENWVDVRTKEFKDWFGDWENDPEHASKVVDENGEPLVVYHDTNSTEFVNVETGEIWDDLGWREKEEWKNRDDFDDYWEERPFYTFDNKSHGRRSIEMPAFFFTPNYDEYHEYGERTIAAFLNIKNPVKNPEIPNSGATDTAGEDAMNHYIEQGYDGFIREYDGIVDEINAFFPNQIKSAEENNGDYSRSDNDIRHSLRGMPIKPNSAEVAKREAQTKPSAGPREAEPKTLKGKEALAALDNIFRENAASVMPETVSSLERFKDLFRRPIRTFLGELVKVKDEVWNKILRNNRQDITGTVLPTIENADFAIRDTDGSTLYVKRFESERSGNLYNIVVVNKHGEVEDYVSSVHIKRDGNLRNKIKNGAELFLPQERNTDGTLFRNNSTPAAKVVKTDGLSQQSNEKKQSRRGTPNLYPDHIAQAIYEQSVNGFKFDLDEAWHDSLLSVKRLQEAISETRGVPIRDFENAYWHAVALSSVNAAEMEQLMNLRIQPFIEAVQDICKKHDLTQEDIEVYLNCKHGLERNEAMARRDAEKQANEEFKDELRKAKRAAAKDPLDQDAADALDDVKQRMNDREEELYFENREKDYSGLTDIFDPKDKVTGKRRKLTVAKLEDEARKCVDKFEAKVGVAEVTKLWDNIHELNNYSLRKSYLSGLISKSQYDSVKQMYQWYVPLRGFNEEVAGDVYTYVTRGETRTQQLLKEAKGRTSRAGDILATMMNMANSAVNQGNRNLMKQKILNLALNAKSPLLSVSSTWYQTDANGFDVPIEPPINDQMTPSEQKDAIEQWEDTMKMQAKQGKVHRMSDNLRLNLRTQKWQADEHCIRVQRGGKEYCVWVNGNPRAAQALNDRLGNQVTKPYKATETILDKAENLFTDGFIKIFRYMAQSVTSLNPEFVISNFQRDLASASLISTGKYGAGYTKDFLVNVKRLGVLTGTMSHKKEYRNAAGIYTLYSKYKSGNLDNNNEMERYFAEFMANGGETGYTQSLSIKDYQSRIQSALGDKGFVKWSKNAGHAVADFVEMANRGVENTCRFAAYMTSRQHGKSVLQAIVDAKEASTNFNLHGAGGFGNAWLRKSIIFINPAVQSIVQYCQLTAKHPKAMLSMLGGTILLGAAMAFACASMVAPGGGDPDSNYWDLSDYVRHNYIVIPSGNGNWTRIALPPEIRAVYGLGVIAMEAAMGRMNHSSIPAAIGDQLMQFSPVAFLDPRNFFNRSDSDHSVGKTLIKAFTPTLASPIADAYIWDEDFMGRQITGKNDFNDDKPEFQRVSYDTLPQLVSFSRWLNNISGGNDYKKGWININPSAAGYVASQYIGGPLQFFTKIGKTVAMITYEDLRDMRNVPFLSRFMTSTDNDYGRNQVSNAEFKYWSAIADDVRTQIRGFEKEIESGDTKNLDDYKKLVSSKEYEMYQMIDYMDWLKDIRELNQKRKEETTQDAQKQVTLEIYEVRRKMAECLNKAEEMGVYLDMSQLNLELANAKTTEERAAIQAKINEKRKENLRKIGAIE